jgi:hypothetical protein
MKSFLIAIILIMPFISASAQRNADSLEVENTLEELFTVCNSVLPEGENVADLIFERVAPYILYFGNDASRNYKSVCDYNKTEDRKLVDKIGLELKNWLDQISDFKVIKYQIKHESNFDWHSLTISYKPASGNNNKIFYFVKLKDKFLLGKIE